MLETLPEELLETIFMQPLLTMHDLVRLKRSSKYLHEMVNSYGEKRKGSLWKAKFLQRWPRCIPEFKRNLITDWQSMCNTRHSLETKTRDVVQRSIQKLIQRNSVPKCILKMFGDSLEEVMRPDAFIYDCVVDILHILIAPPAEEIDGTQSLQYYSGMMMRVVKCEGAKKDWEYLINEVYGGDNSGVPLEYGLDFVGQYLCPLDDERDQGVDTTLNVMCNKIMSSLSDEHESIAKKTCWRTIPYDVCDTLWTCEESAIIMRALVDTMEKKVGDTADVSLDFLHQMKHNWTVPLGVNLCSMLTACMARRLGIQCDMMLRRPPNSHILLRFKNCCSRESSEKNTWVDLSKVWSSGNVYIPTAGIDRQLLTPDRPSTLIELLRFHAEGHIHSITNSVEQLHQFELRLYLDPDNHNMARRIINYYLNQGINIAEAFALADKADIEIEDQIKVAFKDHTEDKELADQTIDEVKERANPEFADVKYYVGMIMRHIRYGYDCVIIGWSTRCDASERWIRQMRVDKLPLGRDQPFYHVLVPDGSQRYAAQESLEYHPSPMPIEHEEVGRYMAAYRETHYKMNYAVQRVYMNDEKFVLDDVRKRYPDLFREVLDESEAQGLSTRL